MFCQKCGKEVREGEKFCQNCGAAVVGNVLNTGTGNMGQFSGMPAEKPKSKKKIILLAGIVIVLILAIGAVVSSGSKNKYVELVKTGSPLSYPDITYGEAFDSFFSDPTWTYFEFTDEKDVVEFSGGCTYQGNEVTATIQFILDVEEGTFSAEYFDMNNVPQTDLATAAIITTVFEDYQNNVQDHKLENISDNEKLELSDYIGMSEDEFLSETGFEKNEYSTYPDEEHAAVICIDGQVNSLMINKADSQNTFKGYGINTSFEKVEPLTQEYSFIDESEIEGGVRKSYMDMNGQGMLAIDVDSQGQVFGIAYAMMDLGETSEGEVQDMQNADVLNDFSGELAVLAENGFDTSILTTPSQVIVSYAKFIAISSVENGSNEPTRTMDDIMNEIFDMGFASDLPYNSYTILNYYINCEIYKGLTTEAAEIIEQYGVDDPWALMEEVDAELDEE